MSAGASFGIIGLGTMGSNLALNVEDHGFQVAVWNLEPERTAEFVAAHPGRSFTLTATFEELVGALDRPRRILIMIPAGDPVDQTLNRLAPLLNGGDVVIDGGNSHYADTARRSEAMEGRGIRYLGMGVSGGAEGARHGPSLMPGGPREGYEAVRLVLEAIAADGPSGPCVGYLGPGGAGHFTKMVHNGIEYADMEGIAEAYDLLHRGLGLEHDDLQDVFHSWNHGPLESFLIEITADIFGVRDPTTGEALVERIVDAAGQKGTGRWTSVAALELGVPTPSIGAAVDARVISSRRRERIAASDRLAGPRSASVVGDRENLVDAARDAVYASRICAFAQGMDLIRAGSAEYNWGIPRAEVARVWTAGCIIRSRLLGPIRDTLLDDPDGDLLLGSRIADDLATVQAGWRGALAACREWGIPTPCWSASLAYYDAIRADRLPTNLTQAQRDYFGAHTYHRLDDPEGHPVHTKWSPSEDEDGG